MQAQAGAQVLKIFESWAEQLPEPMFERLVIRPHAMIVRRLREMGVRVPVIGFPRGAGALVDVYAASGRGHRRGRWMSRPRPSRAGASRSTCRSKGPSIPCCCAPAAPSWDRRVDEMLANWGKRALRLQSRSRHPAGYAGGSCRPDRAPGRGVPSLTPRGKPRLAVVLFNLGGPDGPQAVRPFLYNLFSDPAIITPAGSGAPAPGGPDLLHPGPSPPAPTTPGWAAPRRCCPKPRPRPLCWEPR